MPNFSSKTKLASHTQPGQMLIIALIFLVITMVLVGILFGRTATFLRFGANGSRLEQTVNFAEAGAEYALWQLNATNGIYTPSGSGDIVNFAGGQTKIMFLAGGSAQLRKISTTGCVPDCTTPRRQQIIKVDAITSAGNPWQFKSGTFRFVSSP